MYFKDSKLFYFLNFVDCQGVDVVHSGNIDTFNGCTVIEGSLSILDQTFDGYQDIYPK